MTKKIFSRGLYIESLRQLRLVGIISSVIIFIASILNPLFTFINYQSYIKMGHDVSHFRDVVDYSMMHFPLGFVALLVAPIFTYAMFAGFNRRVASDFYHSLPYTRLCTFLSFTAGTLTWVLGIGLLSWAAGLAAHAIFPQLFVISFTGMGDYILTLVSITLLLVFSVIAGMSLTGTPISNIVCIALILFLPRVLITIMSLTIGDMAPVADTFSGFLSPYFNTLFGLVFYVFDYGFDPFVGNIGNDIYTLCLAVVTGIIAAVLFVCRKSETAAQSAGSKALQHGIRITIGVAISAVGTCMAMSGAESEFVIIIYIIAAIAYFTYELITQRTFKTLVKSLPGVAVVIALNIAIALGCFGATQVILAYEPTADEVEGIYIKGESGYSYGGGYGEVEFINYAQGKAAALKITDEKAIEIAVDSLSATLDETRNNRYYATVFDETGSIVNYENYTVEFISENGIKRTRNIWIKSTDYIEIFNILESKKEFKETYMNIPEALKGSIRLYGYNFGDFSVSDEKLADIVEMLRDEVSELSFEKWLTTLQNNTNYYEDPTCLCIAYTTKADNVDISIPLTREATPEAYNMALQSFDVNTDEMLDKIIEMHEAVDYMELWKDDGKYLTTDFDIRIFAVSADGTAMETYMAPYDVMGMDRDYAEGKPEYISNLLAQLKEAEGEPTYDNFVMVRFFYGVEDENGHYDYTEVCFVLPCPEGLKADEDERFASDLSDMFDGIHFKSESEMYYEKYDEYGNPIIEETVTQKVPDPSGETVVYSCQNSPDPLSIPTIVLDEQKKTFRFTYSVLSSHLPMGTYEITDTHLILRVSDSEEVYCFEIADDTYVFDAELSAELPEYKYTEDSEPTAPVPDGAVFTKVTRLPETVDGE